MPKDTKRGDLPPRDFFEGLQRNIIDRLKAGEQPGMIRQHLLYLAGNMDDLVTKADREKNPPKPPKPVPPSPTPAPVPAGEVQQQELTPAVDEPPPPKPKTRTRNLWRGQGR